MNIIGTYNRNEQRIVMVEGAVDDVACYRAADTLGWSDNQIAHNGSKLYERELKHLLITIPTGKHYRR